MQNGNWVPLSKNLIKYLPHNRPYSKIEAALSVQVDYDNNNEVTILGYANLWQWNRKVVYKFFQQLGIEIIYPDPTKKSRNQKGHIRVHKRDINGTKKGQIRFIDSKWLDKKRDINGAKKGHKRGKKRDTTIYPISSNPDLKKYLNEKIKENNFNGLGKIIVDFFDYRMSKSKKDQYQTQYGIDGLIRDIKGCIDKNLAVEECIEYAMAENWKSFKPNYFNNINIKKTISIPKLSDIEILNLGLNNLKKFGMQTFDKWCVEFKVSENDKKSIIDKYNREN